MAANKVDPSWAGETDTDRAELWAVVGAATGGLTGGIVGLGVFNDTVPAVLSGVGAGANWLAYMLGTAAVGGVLGALTGWGYHNDGDGGHDTH